MTKIGIPSPSQSVPKTPTEISPQTLYEKCAALARNLWWTWHPEVINLFRDLDPIRWRQLDHNPIALLKEFTPERLEMRAAEMVLYSREGLCGVGIGPCGTLRCVSGRKNSVVNGQTLPLARRCSCGTGQMLHPDVLLRYVVDRWVARLQNAPGRTCCRMGNVS